MLREYQNLTSDSVLYFIGREVEHTPFYNQLTLFVAEKLRTKKDASKCLDIILKKIKEYQINHVYLGANQWITKKKDLLLVTEIIKELSLSETSLTLDITYNLYVKNREILDSLLDNCKNLHYNISVKVPNIQTERLTFKIDDIDFNLTNPGVWCYTPRINSKEFTAWEKYYLDCPI